MACSARAGSYKGEQFQHVEQHDIGAYAEPSGDKGGMRHQDVAAFEQGPRVVQSNAFGFAVAARDRSARLGGNQCNEVGKRFHGRGIMVCAL